MKFIIVTMSCLALANVKLSEMTPNERRNSIKNNAARTKRFASHVHLTIYSSWLVFYIASQGYCYEPCALIYNGQGKESMKKNSVPKKFVTEAQKDFNDLNDKAGKLVRLYTNLLHEKAIEICDNFIKAEKGECSLEMYTVKKEVDTMQQVSRSGIKTLVNICFTICRQNLGFMGQG